jgi:hypothetical protein
MKYARGFFCNSAAALRVPSYLESWQFRHEKLQAAQGSAFVCQTYIFQ